MNNLIIPSINQIRLRPTFDNTVTDEIYIEYDNYMPRFDLMTQRVKYQQGINNVDVYPDCIASKELGLQININTTVYTTLTTHRLYNVNTGTYLNIVATDITPGGWVGYDVIKFTVTPTVAGVYKVFLQYDGGAGQRLIIESDEFIVNENLIDLKTLVDIQFKNSENDFGYVFDDYYRFACTGLLDEDMPQIEASTAEEDNYSLLNTKSIRRAILTITDLPKSYGLVVAQIFRCDTILINGMPYCSDGSGIEVQPAEKSDVCNLIIKLKSTISVDSMFYL